MARSLQRATCADTSNDLPAYNCSAAGSQVRARSGYRTRPCEWNDLRHAGPFFYVLVFPDERFLSDGSIFIHARCARVRFLFSRHLASEFISLVGWCGSLLAPSRLGEANACRFRTMARPNERVRAYSETATRRAISRPLERLSTPPRSKNAGTRLTGSHAEAAIEGAAEGAFRPVADLVSYRCDRQHGGAQLAARQLEP
jgi:hypothetical protein